MFQIICKNASKMVEIDARPSDAIAIAVRFDAPIFCVPKVMSEAAIEVSEEDESGVKQKSPKPPKGSVSPAPKKSSSDSLKDFSLDKLNQLLDKAINNEDYEKAARIRDEINKRN